MSKVIVRIFENWWKHVGRVGLSPPKKVGFICFNEGPSKIIKEMVFISC